MSLAPRITAREAALCYFLIGWYEKHGAPPSPYDLVDAGFGWPSQEDLIPVHKHLGWSLPRPRGASHGAYDPVLARARIHDAIVLAKRARGAGAGQRSLAPASIICRLRVLPHLVPRLLIPHLALNMECGERADLRGIERFTIASADPRPGSDGRAVAGDRYRGKQGALYRCRVCRQDTFVALPDATGSTG